MAENFNEMLGPDGQVRAPYVILKQWLDTQSPADLRAKIREAEAIFRRLGITFAVYGNEEAAERLIPFDIIARIGPPGESQIFTLEEARALLTEAEPDDGAE